MGAPLQLQAQGSRPHLHITSSAQHTVTPNRTTLDNCKCKLGGQENNECDASGRLAGLACTGTSINGDQVAAHHLQRCYHCSSTYIQNMTFSEWSQHV